MNGAQESCDRTLEQALDKLNLVSQVDGESEYLCIHILGPDFTEGTCGLDVLATFTDSIRRCTKSYKSIDLIFIGPNISTDMDSVGIRSREVAADHGTLYLSFFAMLYHDFMGKEFDIPWIPSDLKHLMQPDLILACNAGFWGYESWGPTLEFVLRRTGCPCVVTSYNAYEADDDAGRLESHGCELWFWEAERNPASAAVATAVRSPAPPYRQILDNSHWQCFQGQGEIMGQTWKCRAVDAICNPDSGLLVAGSPTPGDRDPATFA